MTANKFQATMRSGPMPGKSFPIEQEEAVLGRDLANEIVISDAEVSRRHARFFLRDDSVFLEDLGSTNGTFLNGERVSTPQQLRSGDVITLGESVMLVFEKISHAPSGAIVTPPVETTVQPVYPAQTHYPPEQATYQPSAGVDYYHQPAPVQPQMVEEDYEPIQPRRERKPKKGGLPTWMVILLVAIAVVACVIAVTLYFMPASWWCAITFDALAGCPLP